MTRRVREPDPVWLDSESQSTHVAFGGFSFQLRGETLSDVRFDGVLLLRAIRFIVRDEDWNTVPGELVSVSPIATENGVTRFSISARNRAAGIEFDWEATIVVDRETLRFSARGTAGTGFRRNRIGIVVLHPATVAGEPLVVRHGNAAPTTTVFPRDVAPHQPARDVAGFDWSSGGVDATLDFEGDVFEMEDQRNWTDASFKTYSTPLTEPFPVEVSPGDTVLQSVVLTARRATATLAPAPAGVIRSTGPRFPSLAVGASTAPDPIGGRPAWLSGSSVLVELDAASPSWRAALDRAGVEAGLDPLDVRVVVTAAEQLGPVLDAVAPLDVTRLGIFHSRSHVSEPELWAALANGAAERGIDATLVGGARSHFTELNRTHDRLPGGLGGLAFSVTPQMHDLERAQVVESLSVQRIVAEQAVRIADGVPVHVGPVTLRSRFNAVSTSPRPMTSTDGLTTGYAAQLVPGATDPRQLGHGYAAWLVSAAAALAVPGVETIAFAESIGDRGFADAAGRRYPASYAIEWLVGVAGWPTLEDASLTAESGEPFAVAVERDGEVVLLLANPHDVAVGVTIHDLPGGRVERFAPNADTPVASGWENTLTLAPGEIVRAVTRR